MPSNIEGFNPHVQYERVEKGKTRPEGRLRKWGNAALRFMRNIGGSGQEHVSAADRLRAKAAQLRQENPHLSPNVAQAPNKDPFAAKKGLLEVHVPAERVDLGHHSSVPSAEVRFGNAERAYRAEQRAPFIVDGQVAGVEHHIPVQRRPEDVGAPFGETTVSVGGRETYGRHDSGETIDPIERPTPAAHAAEYLNPDVIGSPGWHAEQEAVAQAVYDPHETSIGSKSWHGEQRGNKFPPAPIIDVSAGPAIGDEVWQARQERPRRVQAPGGVIGADQFGHEDERHSQKAA